MDQTQPSQPAVGIPVSSTIAGPPALALPVQSRAPAQWSSGLFDCFNDVDTCCMTCICPCITFGRIAEIVDKGASACGVSGALYALICGATGCHWVYSCLYRSRMRGLFFLEESPCPDCLVHLCCESCALCQEYRELKNRGFDMDLGWKGNMEWRTATLAPSNEGGMIR